MRAKQVVSFTVICVVLYWIAPGKAQVPRQKVPVRLYNTAKQKLMEGKQIVGATVFSPDPNIYCAMASAGYDFLWIEMQHSPLTFEDVARMIWACRGAPAMPFIRVPDATEGDIQKATDIGAVGIIVPTVDMVEKAQAAVKWSKYPPEGRRSPANPVRRAGEPCAQSGRRTAESGSDRRHCAALVAVGIVIVAAVHTGRRPRGRPEITAINALREVIE